VKNGIIFLCAANECRSPLMSYQFRHLARGSMWADGWRISSAGARVRQTHPMCEVARDTVDIDADLTKRIARHQSRQMTTQMLHDAEMIITASRAERSAVARLCPDARSRTFTLKEAVLLGELRAVSPKSSLAEVVEELNNRRGLEVLPAGAPRLGWSRRRLHALDLPDDHGVRGGRRHAATLRTIKQLIGQLHGTLQAALG
jgi:protein-tyrosine-phosphatase